MNIESGIPIPTSGVYQPRSECGRAVRAMSIGDCMLCKSEEEKERVRSCMFNSGFKYVSRKVNDCTWRVWRTA